MEENRGNKLDINKRVTNRKFKIEREKDWIYDRHVGLPDREATED